MTKHTPGPWRQGGRLLDITAHGTTIATVNCPSQHPATEATALANARLIAAAPELLEAARQVIWKMGHNERNDEPGGYCGPIRITRSDATVRMLCHAIAAIDGDTDHTCPGERTS